VVAQALIAYLIAMVIMNGQETAKLKKAQEEKDRAPAAVCQAERAEDCPSQENK